MTAHSAHLAAAVAARMGGVVLDFEEDAFRREGVVQCSSGQGYVLDWDLPDEDWRETAMGDGNGDGNGDGYINGDGYGYH